MISDTIKYIGVDDLDIDLFESQYVVPEGMSYNSYLIEDEKIAVMDTAGSAYCRDAGDLSWTTACMQCPSSEDVAKLLRRSQFRGACYHCQGG